MLGTLRRMSHISGSGTGRPPVAGSAPTPDITYTQCKRCGTELAGLDGRYSCGVCGWSNHWSEGHRPLPVAEDDPDAPPPPVNPLGER